MAASNFLAWDAPQNNIQTDAQYAADSSRTNGAATGSILPSPTFNKLAYQLSTFVAAFAQMMVSKGYNISDTNQASLAAVLSNIQTAADGKPAQILLPYSPSITFDCSKANSFRVDLAGNVTSSSLINVPPPGSVITFYLVSQTPGAYSFAWPSNCVYAPDVQTQSTGNLMSYQFISDGGALYSLSTFQQYLQAEIQALQGQTSALQGNVTSLQSNVGTLQGNVSGLQGSVGTLQGQTSTLQGNVSTLQGQTSSLQGNVGTLQGEINTLQSSKQDNLGFTPVQQGGGAGQSSNKIYVGWDGGGLRGQVDATDLGEFVFQAAFNSGLSNLQSLLEGELGDLASANPGGGWLKVAGVVIQWGTTPTLNPNDSRTFNFNIPFPNNCFGVSVSCMSSPSNQGRTVYTRGWNQSSFTCGSNGNDCSIFWIAFGN